MREVAGKARLEDRPANGRIIDFLFVVKVFASGNAGRVEIFPEQNRTYCRVFASGNTGRVEMGDEILVFLDGGGGFGIRTSGEWRVAGG